MESKECQILTDYEESSLKLTNLAKPLLRKCSICKTTISHSKFVKSKKAKIWNWIICYDCKKRYNDKFTWNICFMDVSTRYKKDISKIYDKKN